MPCEWLLLEYESTITDRRTVTLRIVPKKLWRVMLLRYPAIFVSSIRRPLVLPLNLIPSGIAPPRPAALNSIPRIARSWIESLADRPLFLPLTTFGREPEPYAPMTAGSEEDFPLLVQNPNDSFQVSPRWRSSWSPAPSRSSDLPLAIDLTGDDWESPELPSLPLLLET